LQAQDSGLIVILPLIGDKLDRVEEDYFKLFPGIKDFIEAKFYSDDLISMDALVTYSKNGISSDTLIKNYSSLNSVKFQINNIVFANIKNEEHTNVTLNVSGDDQFEGILFSADKNLITILNREIVEKGGIRDNDHLMQNVKTTMIQDVVIEQTASKDYARYGALTGTAAGLATGIILASNRDYYYWYAVNDTVAEIIYITGITAIGAFIGYLAGYLIGTISSTEDLKFNPNTLSGLSDLQEIAPYQKRIKEK
jgi:hypothetical protein